MHPYIPHLLDDIAKAHRTDIPEPAPPQTFEQHIEEVERYLEGIEPDHNFGYYCGLLPENFTPPEQLSIKDVKLVNKAFDDMMFSWNMSMDLPKKMRAKLAYTFIVDCLNEKVDIVTSGFITIDFCTGYAPDCKLKEYCHCLEFWNSLPDKNINEKNFSGDDFPF